MASFITGYKSLEEIFGGRGPTGVLDRKTKKKQEETKKAHQTPSFQRRKGQPFDRKSKDELSKIRDETKRNANLFPRESRIVVKKKERKKEKNAGAVNWLDCVSRDIRVSRGSR